MKVELMGFISDFRFRKISHTATVNDLLKEFFRKSIHICASFVPFLAVWNFNWTITALSLVICIYIYCEYRRLSGSGIPLISRITAYAARKRDEGRFVLGPVTMALGVLFALILFPPEAARIGIFALAFGDGIASLAGKMYGRIQIPFMQGKTVAGSSACFAAVYLSTLLVTHDPVKALLVATVGMILEVLPIRDYDNLIIPVCISAFMCLLP